MVRVSGGCAKVENGQWLPPNMVAQLQKNATGHPEIQFTQKPFL